MNNKSIKKYQELYPISHHFYPNLEYKDESPILKEYINKFGVSNEKSKDNLLYLHIPFCNSICLFCPFHVGVKHKSEEYQKYVSYLITEMELVSKRLGDLPITSIYFGGGSPSILSPHQIDYLFDNIREKFNVASDVEITFEGEPISLNNDELLEVLEKNKVNRVSYGVQTFNVESRNLLKVGATLDDVYKCRDNLRKHNINEINIDMMFYLPGQGINDLEKDLNDLFEFGADSVDYYYLSYFAFPEKYFKDIEKGIVPPKPPKSSRQEMNKLIREKFRSSNYNQFSESYYSMKDYPKCFKSLWGGGNGMSSDNVVAIGASSRGYIDNRSYANHLKLSDYYASLDEEQIPIQSISESVSTKNRGMVFFPKFLEIDKVNVPSEYLSLILELVKYGMLEEQTDKYIVSDEGLDWFQSLTADFFTPHQLSLSKEMIRNLEDHYSNKVTVYG